MPKAVTTIERLAIIIATVRARLGSPQSVKAQFRAAQVAAHLPIAQQREQLARRPFVQAIPDMAGISIATATG